VRDGQRPVVRGDQDVHGLGRDLVHDLSDDRGVADAGGVQAIGAGIGEGGETFQREARGVGSADEPGFATR
jgi:hypothetical protein